MSEIVTRVRHSFSISMFGYLLNQLRMFRLLKAPFHHVLNVAAAFSPFVSLVLFSVFYTLCYV